MFTVCFRCYEDVITCSWHGIMLDDIMKQVGVSQPMNLKINCSC